MAHIQSPRFLPFLDRTEVTVFNDVQLLWKSAGTAHRSQSSRRAHVGRQKVLTAQWTHSR